MALNKFRPCGSASPDLFEIASWRKPAYYYLVLFVGRAVLRADPPPGQLARRPRHDRAAGERAARQSVGVDVTRYLVLAAVVSAAMAGAAGASTRTTCASSTPTSSSSSTR